MSIFIWWREGKNSISRILQQLPLGWHLNVALSINGNRILIHGVLWTIYNAQSFICNNVWMDGVNGNKNISCLEKIWKYEQLDNEWARDVSNLISTWKRTKVEKGYKYCILLYKYRISVPENFQWVKATAGKGKVHKRVRRVGGPGRRRAHGAREVFNILWKLQFGKLQFSLFQNFSVQFWKVLNFGGKFSEFREKSKVIYAEGFDELTTIPRKF